MPEIDDAFAAAARQHADALAFNDSLFASWIEQVAALALRHRIPVITSSVLSAVSPPTGLSVSYGADIPEICRQASIYVGRILKGEMPGGPAGAVADQVPSRGQSQDREGARSYGPRPALPFSDFLHKIQNIVPTRRLTRASPPTTSRPPTGPAIARIRGFPCV